MQIDGQGPLFQGCCSSFRVFRGRHGSQCQVGRAGQAGRARAGQGRLWGKKKKTAHHGRMAPCKVACVCTQYAVWIRTLVSIGSRSLHCTGHEPINCPDWESGWPDGVYRNDVLTRVICTISTRRARIEANRRPGAEEEAASKEKEPH